MNTPFVSYNANLFGTKLMDILFSKEEMRNGYFEEGKKKDRVGTELSPEKVNLIKGYI